MVTSSGATRGVLGPTGAATGIGLDGVGMPSSTKCEGGMSADGGIDADAAGIVADGNVWASGGPIKNIWLHFGQRIFTPAAGMRLSSTLNLALQESQ